MMARSDDDALTWDGDDDPTLDTGAPASVAKPPAACADPTVDAATADPSRIDTALPGAPASTAGQCDARHPRRAGWLLLHLHPRVGDRRIRLQGRAHYLVTDIMFQGSFWLAVLAPALWFGTVFLLTRLGVWVRIVWLVGRARSCSCRGRSSWSGRWGDERTVTDAAASRRRSPMWVVATMRRVGLF